MVKFNYVTNLNTFERHLTESHSSIVLEFLKFFLMTENDMIFFLFLLIFIRNCDIQRKHPNL